MTLDSTKTIGALTGLGVVIAGLTWLFGDGIMLRWDDSAPTTTLSVEGSLAGPDAVAVVGPDTEQTPSPAGAEEITLAEQDKQVTTPVCSGSIICGVVSFDYDSNNGLFLMGREPFLFETEWSRSSKSSIQCYNDPESIRGLGIAVGVMKIDEIVDATDIDMTSRMRTAMKREWVVFRNANDFYAAVQVIDIMDRTRGDERDELLLHYYIQTNGSSRFGP